MAHDMGGPMIVSGTRTWHEEKRLEGLRQEYRQLRDDAVKRKVCWDVWDFRSEVDLILRGWSLLTRKGEEIRPETYVMAAREVADFIGPVTEVKPDRDNYSRDGDDGMEYIDCNGCEYCDGEGGRHLLPPEGFEYDASIHAPRNIFR